MGISSTPGVHPPRSPTPLPAVVTSLIPGECPPRPPFYQMWLRGFSPIPGVRPPRPPLCLCQLWLRGCLTYPWSTHTTPSQVWLSHPSLEYAHHAHLSASASCGYVAISLIPGVRTPRTDRCGYVAISPIPEVRPPRPLLCLCQLWLRGYLTYPGIMPTTPILLPAVATWLLINPWSTHTTPSQMCLCHLSLEYAHHAHPLPAVATWLSHLSLEHAYHARSSTSCGYAAMPPNPGVRPTHPAICQVWLCGHLLYPLNTPATPTLCQQRLCNYLIYP